MTAHAPYPPPDLATTAKETTREILSVPSLLLFLDIKQGKTLGGLPEGATHPAVDLLRAYVEEVITAHTVPQWLLQAL